MTASHLKNRAIVRLSPTDSEEDVGGFLQGLVTNDVTGDLPVYAALLSAQGKALFDFLVWGEGKDILIDCEAAFADDLVKRLSLYRLRRKITIARDESLSVLWSTDAFEGSQPDPRLSDLGHRALVQGDAPTAADDDYRAHRLSLGVPEGSAELGDILWLETNAVELNGVSFDKGCYIGQENTARMNWRQKVNRRLVVVPLAMSDEKRQKIAYPDLALAVDHLRVADLDPSTLPEWQRAGIADQAS